jgi:hypothetical protein
MSMLFCLLGIGVWTNWTDWSECATTCEKLFCFDSLNNILYVIIQVDLALDDG